MFADNIGMNGLRGNAEVIAEQGTEAGGIKNRAGADNALFGKTGKFKSHFGHNIRRVGGNNQSGVGSGLSNLRNDAFKNFDVAKQVYAGFAGFLIGSGGNDDDFAAFQVFISSGFDFVGVSKRRCMGNVHRFSLRLFFVGVN